MVAEITHCTLPLKSAKRCAGQKRSQRDVFQRRRRRRSRRRSMRRRRRSTPRNVINSNVIVWVNVEKKKKKKSSQWSRRQRETLSDTRTACDKIRMVALRLKLRRSHCMCCMRQSYDQADSARSHSWRVAPFRPSDARPSLSIHFAYVPEGSSKALSKSARRKSCNISQPAQTTLVCAGGQQLLSGSRSDSRLCSEVTPLDTQNISNAFAVKGIGLFSWLCFSFAKFDGDTRGWTRHCCSWAASLFWVSFLPLQILLNWLLACSCTSWYSCLFICIWQLVFVPFPYFRVWSE